MPKPFLSARESEQTEIDRYLRGELSEAEAERFETEQLADSERLDAAYAAVALSLSLRRGRAPAAAKSRPLGWGLGASLAAVAAASLLLVLQTTGLLEIRPTSIPPPESQAQFSPAPPRAENAGPEEDSTAVVPREPSAVSAGSVAAQRIGPPSAAHRPGLDAERAAIGPASGSSPLRRIVVASGSMGSSQIRILNATAGS